MSPRRFNVSSSSGVNGADRRLWFGLGRQIHDARVSRKLSVSELAQRAGVSTDVIYLVESGRRASTEAVLRIVGAMNLRLDFAVSDPRRKEVRPSLGADVVHSAMGEFEARHFRQLGYPLGIDEPYQHYQFAGRADLIAWDVEKRALLHIENRTRFPDFQEMAGAFNTKKAYLGEAVAARVGVTRWASETHVIATLWSSEVLHALRLRTESFRALCRDGTEAFADWWVGQPGFAGRRAVLVVVDPLAVGRQRTWIGLDDALSARPRHQGYADIAGKLAMNGATAAASRSG